VGDAFFTEQAEQSEAKTAIVTKYFGAWAKVITGHQKRHSKGTRIAYIDLFAGPGRYEDGTKSTPLLILERAIADPILRQSLVTIFNDKDEDNSHQLQTAIDGIDGIAELKFAPRVNHHEVGEQIVRMFESMKLIPTLFFVDPWGYKGLSLRLINSVLKNWACECIFFFNYNRINAGLSNELVRMHMEALFGDRAADLAAALGELSPDQRELTIIEEICEALVAMGGKYVLPFCFKNNKGTRTSHHLIFVTKDPLGYEIMKDVMANVSTTVEQGVPTFEFNPADRRQPLLFELARPLDDLEAMLLEAFAGKTLTLEEIYQSHNYGRRYVRRNYKDVLAQMETSGKISADPPRSQRRKRLGEVTFPDRVKVTFP
jgi:three-Cys-motif partner protein